MFPVIVVVRGLDDVVDRLDAELIEVHEARQRLDAARNLLPTGRHAPTRAPEIKLIQPFLLFPLSALYLSLCLRSISICWIGTYQ
jgi:hypothetical protein